jgi:hypothetical protein
MKDIRLRDLPSFVQATDPNDCLFNFCLECAERASEGSPVICSILLMLWSKKSHSLNVSSCLQDWFTSITSQWNARRWFEFNWMCNLWKEEAECLRLMAGFQDAQRSNLCEFWQLSGRYKAAAHWIWNGNR